ncbi:heparan-alpha-glucosaminide N-acetyltransferase domain-containing protein [Microbacterium gubbeenense]|uniref:heparan-alpha-glucosaminide N-acetyltransferase domain-containing protein n=4 Tax=Microbacterium gubbeenense TaxID=159896 RepID=UPI0004058A59|nr:heparan-alpha-glucosaminide N-acetyltransferase domain-containing protein [Microbacterium gubbeenense]
MRARIGAFLKPRTSAPAGRAPNRREGGVDLARGLAVFGMFAAHVVATAPEFHWTDPASWSAAVNGNSSILFAVLAGVSLGLLTGGSAPHAGVRLATDRRRTAVRAALIYAVGIALWLMPAPVYVILPAYGILFLLALPLLSWRPRWLLAMAGAVAVVAPFVVAAIDHSDFWSSFEGAVVKDLTGWHYPFLAWIAFVAVGIAVARIGFDRPLTVLATGLIAAGISCAGFGVIGRFGVEALSSEPHTTGIGEMFGSGGLAVAVVCACVLVCRTPLTWIVWPVRVVGSMPLTAYAGQLIAWSVWIWAQDPPVDPIGGFHAVDPFWPMVLATVFFCCAWNLIVGRGPLEWAVGAISTRAVRARLDG